MAASSSDRTRLDAARPDAAPSAASRAATLRLSGILVCAATVLRMLSWFLPGGSPLLDSAIVLISAALLASAASAVARGGDARGGLVGRGGAAAFLVVAVLLVLRPLVSWFSSTSGPEPTQQMVLASALVLAMAAATGVAALVGFVALLRARTARASVAVAGIVAVLLAALSSSVPSIALLVTAAPSQEVLVTLWSIGGWAAALAMLALGVCALLASRSISRNGR